ncbi:MAG: hypothetical protein ACO1OB_15055 [Archangium sp.]
MKLALASASLITLASCGQVCTEIGCTQTVRFVLPGEAAMKFEEGPALVRTCINGVCWDASSADTASLDVFYDATSRVLQVRHDVNFNGAVADVTLAVSRDGNALFGSEWNDVDFQSEMPNGPSCPPTCRSAGPLTFPE